MPPFPGKVGYQERKIVFNTILTNGNNRIDVMSCLRMNDSLDFTLVSSLILTWINDPQGRVCDIISKGTSEQHQVFLNQKEKPDRVTYGYLKCIYHIFMRQGLALYKNYR